MRLHIGESAAEQPLGAVYRKPLGNIDILAAAVIAPPRISLGILVGQQRALCLEHRSRHDVFTSDQLDLRLLPLVLAADGGTHFRIRIDQGIAEKAGGMLGHDRRDW